MWPGRGRPNSDVAAAATGSGRFLPRCAVPVGLEIIQEEFGDEDHARFGKRLADCLRAFRALLARPGFGVGPTTLGAELEMSLIDGAGHALPLNRAVLRDTLDPRFTVELDRFNLECNLRHTTLAGRPFAHLRTELQGGLSVVREAAGEHGGRVVPIGILPTLRPKDLDASHMTDSVRYRVLASALRRLRQRPFEFHIDGEEPLHLQRDDVTFEGAATSLQLHLRVMPGDFSDAFNAAQIATGPALAIAGNSPTFIGHRLWRETRIALFKQAVDDRTAEAQRRHAEPRVAFGHGWLRDEGALALFEQGASREVLLPVCGPESTEHMMIADAPLLDEMRLHQGTVWSWNRPVYDPADGGHVRIELRALPSGPTTPDMLANIAFLIGLTRHLQRHGRGFTDAMPFAQAERNFYRAAQRGLDAQLHWPSPRDGAPRPESATTLVKRLLPLAREGLLESGVEHDDAEPWLQVLTERCRGGQTGASWQLAALRAHEARGLDRRDALHAVLDDYLAHSEADEPVHTWPLP